MAKNIFETLVGALVLCVAIGFIFIALEAGNIHKPKDGISLEARFERIDGLGVGSDVRISGLSVGSVSNATIDPETFRAIVTFTIRNDIKLPDDSTAEIIGDGLLGSKYLALVPGGSDSFYGNGDEIAFTQSAVSIESLIGKFMFGSSDDEEDEEDEDLDDEGMDEEGEDATDDVF